MNVSRRGLFGFLTGAVVIAAAPQAIALPSKPTSALESAKLRRLIDEIKRDIEDISKHYMFQTNDDFTRAQLENEVQTNLEALYQNNQLYDYAVTCDSTNNLGDWTVRAPGRDAMRLDVFIRPKKAVQYIQLRTTITNGEFSFW